MKKYITVGLAALVASLALSTEASAQSGVFNYNDGDGAGDAGSYAPGSSFTFSITLAFTPGGTIGNLEGVSYWFEQVSPAGAPFNFAITLRDITGSMFTFEQTPGLTYPQNLASQNDNDLGALLPGNTGVGAGSYFLANITVSIDPAAAPGVYTIGNTISGGKTSVYFDDGFLDSAPIPRALYTITVIPEPSTYALLGFAAIGLVGVAVRRRSLN